MLIAFAVIVALTVASAAASIYAFNQVTRAERAIVERVIPVSVGTDQVVNHVERAISLLGNIDAITVEDDLKFLNEQVGAEISNIRKLVSTLNRTLPKSGLSEPFETALVEFQNLADRRVAIRSRSIQVDESRTAVTNILLVSLGGALDVLAPMRIQTMEIITQNKNDAAADNSDVRTIQSADAVDALIILNDVATRFRAIEGVMSGLGQTETASAVSLARATTSLNLRILVRHAVENRVPGLRATMAPALSQIVDAVNNANGVLALMAELVDLRGEGRKSTQDNRQSATRVRNLANLFVDLGNSLASTATANSRKAVKDGRRIVIGLTIISLIGACLIVWLYVYRNVVARMTRLTATTRSLAGGDLLTPVPDLGDDELGDMARAVDQFKANAQRLQEQEEELIRSNAEIRKREHEVEIQRQRLEDSLEAIPNAFQLWDNEDNLLYINGRYGELRPEMVDALVEGISMMEFGRHAVAARMPGATEEQIDRQLVKAGDAIDGDEHLTPEGRWLMRSVRPTREGGRVIVLTDITGLKQAQQKLEQQAIELQRSNVELEQFVYLASHDLQEPLRVVGSYCDLLEQRYSDQLDNQAREFIGYAVDGARRMRSLIDDLLDYSKVGSEKIGISTFDIGDSIESSLRALHTLITENDADISWEEMPMVRGSSSLIAQVFQNLIGNAIKFRSAEQPRIRISTERDGALWKISVADNGIGIQPEYADRVFRIFQRLHSRSEYAGNGLGLALSQRVISRHGGEIWVETSATGGATVCFTLPALAD